MSRRKKPDGKYQLIGGSDKTIDSSWESCERTNEQADERTIEIRIWIASIELTPSNPQDEYIVIIQTT